MAKFHVGEVDDGKFYQPSNYAKHSEGYRRLDLIDDTTSQSSVHMGVCVVEIAAAGGHEPVVNAFEKGFYILSGELVINFHGRAHLLTAGHYGVIQKGVEYTFYNPGKSSVRIFEMNAPQPKSLDHDFNDIIFQPSEFATSLPTPPIALRQWTRQCPTPERLPLPCYNPQL